MGLDGGSGGAWSAAFEWAHASWDNAKGVVPHGDRCRRRGRRRDYLATDRVDARPARRRVASTAVRWVLASWDNGWIELPGLVTLRLGFVSAHRHAMTALVLR